MDARKLLQMVQEAMAESVDLDLYSFAAKIVELQKEEDAKVAEALGHPDVAEVIRA